MEQKGYTVKLLTGRKVLLGVTGSIAAYKSPEIVRLLSKMGADVRVVMSDAAERFVTPLTFEALTREAVLYQQNENWRSEQNHIDWGKWADILVIAPATANTINKITAGIADTLLLQTVLAFQGALVMAPAANPRMLDHPATEHSLKRLRDRGVKVISPRVSKLACLEEGSGAMAEVEEIAYVCSRVLLKHEQWAGKTVLITGGGTQERIDDVRVIANRSSGKMANALALAFYYAGAEVVFVSSVFDSLPLGIQQHPVQSAAEMKEAVHQEIKNRSVSHVIAAAAVSDYVPKAPKSGKIKKSEQDEWMLELTLNEDILESLQAWEGCKVGFKLEEEWEKGRESARNMLDKKSLHAVCLNVLADAPLGSDVSKMEWITPGGTDSLQPDSKLQVAMQIVQKAAQL